MGPWQAGDMRAVDINPIDEYLRALDRHLRGPARLKADLLAEARGGLEDAASAYREDGLAPTAAGRRAVAEFGEPRGLAAAYQVELAAAYGRRLALLVAMLPVAMLTADTMWWQAPEDTAAPPTGFLFVTEAVDWTAYAAGALALLSLVQLGRRRGPDPRRVARLLGGVALVSAGSVWLLGTFAAATAVLDSPAALAWPPMLLALVCLNGGTGYLMAAGARCMAAARGPVVA
jgi:hypothetical protein